MADLIDELAYLFWSIHPKDIPEPVGMPEGYKGGKRAWFYANEMRRIAALPAQGVRGGPPFHFDRYINGVLMAEGVTIERETNFADASRVASRIASKGPNGEAPVLVLTFPHLNAQGVNARKVIQERIDTIISEEGSWEPDTNVTNLPEWAETAVEELEGILAALAPAEAGGVEAHVNETPKSEHDAGDVLTPAPVDALVKAAEAIADDACSYICPSTGKAGEPIPHDPRCVALRDAIADAKGGRDA